MLSCPTPPLCPSLSSAPASLWHAPARSAGKETPSRPKALGHFQGLQEILIRNIPLPQEAKQHVQDIVESPHRSAAQLSSVQLRIAEAFFLVCVPFPSSYRNSLGATSLPAFVPALFPSLCRCPFGFPFNFNFRHLIAAHTSREQNRKKEEEKRGKRGNSLGCQVPIVGFTFGPDKLKCPRTIPGVDFLFMCPLALSLTIAIVFGLPCGLPFRFFSSPRLALPPVLRSCSASGKPLN